MSYDDAANAANELNFQIRRLAVESDGSAEETVSRNIAAMERWRAENAELRAANEKLKAEAEWRFDCHGDPAVCGACISCLLRDLEAAKTECSRRLATIEMLNRELASKQRRKLAADEHDCMEMEDELARTRGQLSELRALSLGAVSMTREPWDWQKLRDWFQSHPESKPGSPNQEEEK
jgi:hypothetical protein